MQEIVGESLARRLVEWGVDTVFGLPGDGINGLMEGFRAAAGEAAVRPGAPRGGGRLHGHRLRQGHRPARRVLPPPPGPGAIHLLNGLYDAKLDHVPVLAITGMQETSVLGSHYQQEVHLDRLYQDVADVQPDGHQPAADAGGGRPRDPQRAGASGRCAHLTLPQRHPGRAGGRGPVPARQPRQAAGERRRGVARRSCRRTQADLAQRGRGAQRRAARSPCWSASAPAHAREEVLAVAEALASPIVKTLPGQAGGARRPPAHHRRARPARHRAERGADGGVRHPADGRHLLPVREVPARAGAGAGGADRRRPQPDRHAAAGRGAGRRRRRGWRCGSCCRCSSAARTARSWRSTSARWTPGGRTWRACEDPDRDPIAPQYLMTLHRRGRRRRRHPHLRLGHHRHLGGAALDDPRRPRVLPVGQPRHDGARACRTRSRCSTPSRAGR